MKKILTLSIGFVLTMVSVAQKHTPFPVEDEKFLKELSQQFESQVKGLGKELIKDKLEPSWLTPGTFTDDEKKQVRESLDLLLTKRYQTVPVLQNYIETILALKESGKSEYFNSFQQVFIACINMSSNKTNKHVDHLSIIAKTLFKSNALFVGPSHEWKFENNSYTFVFDSMPKINFTSGNLVCASRLNDIKIEDTKGYYSIQDKLFFGQGGRVPWNISGYDPKKTYATLNTYEIALPDQSYSAENVYFHSEYSNTPLKGTLEDKLVQASEGNKRNYPVFQSTEGRIQIKNIIPNVDYEGGFILAGESFKGTGPQNNPAQLIINKDGKKFLESKSQLFNIRPQIIESLSAQIKFAVDSDSIFHPSLYLALNRKTRELTLSRTEDGVSPSPFINTYHNMEMYFESIQWNIDAPLMNFGAYGPTAQKFADFESVEYFDKERYRTIQGISTIHPCTILSETYNRLGQTTFTIVDFATTARTGIEQWIPLLFDLNVKGYIIFEPETRMITIKPKLLNHIETNRLLKDYDILQFSSSVNQGSNAQLSLLSQELKIEGVNNIVVSDSQLVRIYPKNGTVILKKDRDFSFDGTVYAGNLHLAGAKFDFDYDMFELQMNQVDSCIIFIDDTLAQADIYGNKPKKIVKTMLRNLSGTLEIDHPMNKSGYISKDYTLYPKLNCTRKSDVFWDSKSIQSGAYSREEFSYTLEPFNLDSLDNFMASNLVFQGELESNGMLPTIKEPLVLMPDNSLGFHINTGAEGMKAYDGKLTLQGDLNLDHTGMKSKGDINYLTTQASSDELTLTPQMLFGKTTTYTNESNSKANVPDLTAKQIEVKYKKDKEILIASTLSEDVVAYKNEATFKGSTYLSPKGIQANGNFELIGASIQSKNFNLKSRIILADTSSFYIKNADNTNALALRTDNVNSNVDFDKRKGIFKSNNGETKIEFPANLYICFMDQFTWFMDKSELELSSSRKASTDLVIDTDQEKRKSNFFSIHADQDSLNFLSPYAKYDLKESRITCNKIDYIIVADSKVQPDSNYVVINRNANMQELNRAQVISNFVTQHHKIFNAKVKINGRKDYSGSGDIVFKDENKLEQTIHLNYFGLDATYQTTGSGEITEKQEFWLSPAYQFQGKFEFFANNPHYQFDGGVKILHNCASLDRNFFSFKSIIDPTDIFIPVSQDLKDYSGSALALGVMVAEDASNGIYPAFFSNKLSGKDSPILQADGFLYYDKVKKQYIVGSKEKIRQPKLNGQLINLSVNSCDINCDGKLNFNVDYGMLTMNSVGQLKFSASDSSVTAKTVTLFNFPMNEDIQKHIGEKIITNEGLTPIDVSKTLFEKSLVEILGTEKSDKVITDMALDGSIKRFPEEFQTSIFFSDLNWKWNAEHGTLVAVGNLGIGGMGKKQAFKYVKGVVEIQQKKTGDILTIYLEVSSADYYLIEYKGGVMTISTPDAKVGEIYANLKDSDRVFEDGKKRFSFNYVSSAKKKIDALIEKYPELEK